MDNIPSVADLTASFAARKEERLRQEAEKKETERRVSVLQVHCIAMAIGLGNIIATQMLSSPPLQNVVKELLFMRNWNTRVDYFI